MRGPLTIIGLIVFATISFAQTIPGFIQADRDMDGNRLLLASLPLGTMNSARLPLGENAAWIAGYFAGGSPGWIVALDDGSLIRVRIQNDVPVWNPVAPAQAGGRSQSDHDGTLTLLWDDKRDNWFPAEAGVFPEQFVGDEGPEPLLDGHIAAGRDQIVAYLSGATTSYPHGVLGDAVEARSVTILSNRPIRTVSLAPYVAEERGVLLRDLNGDGTQELITILADAQGGAFVAAFSAEGELLTRGEPIGRGFRWRHLVGAGPIGPFGEELMAVVRTPHIGGAIEYYDADLRILASVPGYSSHEIGSRSLGDAWIVNVDGDGRWEVLLPVQQRDQLEAISLSPQGPRRVWSYELNSRLSSNLGIADPATDAPAGSPGLEDTARPIAALMVGTTDGMLHVWWQ